MRNSKNQLLDTKENILMGLKYTANECKTHLKMIRDTLSREA
jgi:hypothetical protein